MNDKNLSLTKICSHCGEQKPLTAFLQLTDTHGSSYGTVCATCRKTVIEMANRKRDTDEVTTSSSGFKIDAKAKVQAESDKRKLRKELQEQDQAEKEKTDELKIDKEIKTQTRSRDEKKHRQTFLEKRPLTDKKSASTEQAVVFGGEDEKAREGKLDFAAGPVEYTRVAGTLKTQSSVFQSFKTWLGGAAPIVKAAEKAAKQPANEKNPVTEFVEKNYRPKSGK